VSFWRSNQIADLGLFAGEAAIGKGRGSSPQTFLESRKGHDDDDSAEIGKIEFDLSYT
jgi:hypothetical protein